MTYSVALLVFGILLLVVGLVGTVKAKELEIGTESKIARIIIGVLGVALVALSIYVENVVPPSEPVPGTLQFSSSAYELSEDSGSMAINVTRINGSDGRVSTDYAASDGTATGGEDYERIAGTLTWQDGETITKSFGVSIINDGKDEPNEALNLKLNNVSGGSHGNPNSAVLTIVDDDPPEPQAAMLTVDVNPSGASVQIPEIDREYEPGMNLSPGVYKITVSRDGYKSWEDKIGLRSGSQTIHVTLEPENCFGLSGVRILGLDSDRTRQLSDLLRKQSCTVSRSVSKPPQNLVDKIIVFYPADKKPADSLRDNVAELVELTVVDKSDEGPKRGEAPGEILIGLHK